MNRKIIFLLLLSTILISTALQAEITLRAKGGWSIASGEFDSKTRTVGGDLNFTQEFKADGKQSFSGEVKIKEFGLPIPVVFGIASLTFDDLGWELQETTYEYPLGTGRYTDFVHRFVSLTIGSELAVWRSGSATGFVGIGTGIYWHRFEDANDIPDSPQFAGWKAHWGSKIYYYQQFRITKSLGVIIGLDHNIVFVADDAQINPIVPGFYTRLSFYRIEAGVKWSLGI